MGLFDCYIFSVAVALRYTRTASTLGNRFEPVGNSTEATRMSVRGYSNSFCSSTKTTSIHVALKTVAQLVCPSLSVCLRATVECS